MKRTWIKMIGFFFVLTLITGMLLVGTTQEVNADTLKTYGVVTEGPLNVRSGPDIHNTIYGKLEEGSKVTILGSQVTDGVKWYVITYQSKKAYVCSNYIKITASEYFYSTSRTSTVIAGPLNIRSGPGTGYTVVGSASPMKVVYVKSRYNIVGGDKWYQITWNGKKAYVNARYIALNTKGSTVKTYNPNKTGTTTTALNVRVGPTLDYAIAGTLSNSKTFTILGEVINTSGSKWFMLTYQSRVCYVKASYVKLTTVTASVNAQKIIDLALSKVGSDYVYGTEGPDTFDCSGLVYWVFNHSGIDGVSVPRTSGELYSKYKTYNIGTNIGNARPADIILFSDDGTAGGISHSAIYYKEQTMIHASTPATGVIITPISYSLGNKDIFAIIRMPGL